MPSLREGDRRVPGSGRTDALQLWHHLARKQAHVPLGLVPRHAGIAEEAVVPIRARDAADAHDLLEALLGRAPDLDAEEELGGGVRAADAADDVLQARVRFIAFRVLQMVAAKL